LKAFLLKSAIERPGLDPSLHSMIAIHQYLLALFRVTLLHEIISIIHPLGICDGAATPHILWLYFRIQRGLSYTYSPMFNSAFLEVYHGIRYLGPSSTATPD
jgi:hypothetical protein